MDTNALRAERARIWDRLNELADKASHQPLSINERASFDRDTREAERLTGLIGGGGEQTAPNGKQSTRRVGDQFADNDEFQEFVRAGSRSTSMWLRPQQELEVTTPNDYRANTYLTTSPGSGNTGSSYYAPDETYKSVVMGILDASGILACQPTLIVSDSMVPICVPTLTQDAVAVAGAEGSPATAVATQGDHVDLGANRFDGVMTVSYELTQSSAYNLPQLLATYASRSLGNAVADFLAIQSNGVFYAGNIPVGVTCTDDQGPTVDELIELTKSVSSGYRRQAKLLVSDALHLNMLQMKYTLNGEYCLMSVDGTGEVFAGKPIICEGRADQSGMSASEIHAIYGDFSGLFVRLSPIFMRRDDTTDPLNIRFTYAVWCDCKLADQNSLVSLKMASS